MINNREAKVTFNQTEIIDVPYSVGTIIEFKNNPNIMAKIIQYRITEQAKVGLSFAIDIDNKEDRLENQKLIFKMPQKFIIAEFTNMLDLEITLKELEANWKKTDKIVIGNIDFNEYNQYPEFSNRQIKK